MEIDESSDQYSLGAILYVILTWQESPFPVKMSTGEVLNRVVEGRIVPPRKAAPKRKISRELEAICLKAMSLDPRDRYKSIRELTKEIRNYLDLYPVGVCTSWTSRMVKWARRHPLIPATAAGALATAILFGGGLLGSALINHRLHCEMVDSNLVQMGQSLGVSTQLHRKLRQGAETLPAGTVEKVRRELNLQQAEFDNAAAAAIDHLGHGSREFPANRSYWKSKAAEILHFVLSFDLQDAGPDRAVRHLHQAQTAWGPLFHELTAEDPELRWNVRMLQRSEGMLYWDLKNAGDLFLIPANGLEQPLTEHGMQRLAAGDYLLHSVLAGRPEIFIPVRIRPAMEAEVRRDLPENFPPDLRYVASPVEYSGDSAGISAGGRAVKPFCIRRTEVSFAEYLEFWRSLPPGNDRAAFRAWELTEAPAPQLEYLWDEQGRLKHPEFASRPVTGISGEAAAAYCRWLSRKSGRAYRLPEAREFFLAAAGSPQDAFGDPDRFAFDAGDLNGSVREYVTEGEDRRICVARGSSNVPSGTSRSSMTFPAGAFGHGAGFRYVMELPEKKAAEQND